MSSNTISKPKILKFTSKSKKYKFPFLTDIEEIAKRKEIDKKYNSKSCEKKDIHYGDINNIKITNNIIEIKDLDDLKILPLKNINYIYSAWKSSNLIFENFEKKILNKKDFEIDYEKFDIKTKNEKACNEIKDEKFWILFSDYLIKNNKIKNTKDFLKLINNAFSNLDFNYKLLLYYYFDKIKKFNPIKKDGITENRDGPYIELLNKEVKSRIKMFRENLKSDIKIAPNHKYNLHNFYEYTPFKKNYKL
jgi:hypothetical protein